MSAHLGCPVEGDDDPEAGNKQKALDAIDRKMNPEKARFCGRCSGASRGT